eukprot:494610-Alexandrium_andersonii.AAC.1
MAVRPIVEADEGRSHADAAIAVEGRGLEGLRCLALLLVDHLKRLVDAFVEVHPSIRCRLGAAGGI